MGIPFGFGLKITLAIGLDVSAYEVNESICEKMFVQTWMRGQHSMSLAQDRIPRDRNKVSSKCPALFKSKLDLEAVLR